MTDPGEVSPNLVHAALLRSGPHEGVSADAALAPIAGCRLTRRSAVGQRTHDAALRGSPAADEREVLFPSLLQRAGEPGNERRLSSEQAHAARARVQPVDGHR